MTLEQIPAPSIQSLQERDCLADYLVSVVSHIRSLTGASEVAVYLADPSTRRLTLRAWSAGSHDDGEGSAPVPNDLTEHGIDGTVLSVGTLRDFVHAAPGGQRLAKPIHDGTSWIGAIVGVADVVFSDDASRIFLEAGAELAQVLSEANVRVSQLLVEEPESSLELPSEAIYGHGASEGKAYAPALLYDSVLSRDAPVAKVEESREEAIRRLDAAIEATRRQLERLNSDTFNELYDVISLLFTTHLIMLTDEAFSGEIRALVEAGQTPEDAVQSVVASYVRTFRNLREARLAEKAQDVRDIGYRLIANLRREEPDAQDFAGRVVLVEDVLPSDLIRLALGHAAGVVILGAEVTAHISILAQSLSLPVLMTSDRRAGEIVDNTLVLLDADGGRLFISPADEQVSGFGFDTTAPGAVTLRDRVSGETGRCAGYQMADGTPFALFANVNLLSDARRGAALNACGIGLYRSEFPFIIRNDFINEEEQYRIYRAIVQAMPGKPVTLRTMDIGGDKLMAGREEERNPFLGVRGIRFSLANRDLFTRQIRAMLRAGAGADLGIMFPMVSGLDEVEQAAEEVHACLEALQREGIEHNHSPRIGAMVELPSAVISIEELRDHTDFLSIGTNDLIMYLLAVDRTNERLSQLYRSHHPVVLRTVANIARTVGPDLSTLSVCGESAADPIMIPFYLGLGITNLSVAPRHLDTVASVAARYTREGASSFAEHLLSIRNLRDMDEFISTYHHPGSTL